MANEYGLLWALDLAIKELRSRSGANRQLAADRLQRERDMRHAINQGWGKRYRAAQVAQKLAQTPEPTQGITTIMTNSGAEASR